MPKKNKPQYKMVVDTYKVDYGINPMAAVSRLPKATRYDYNLNVQYFLEFLQAKKMISPDGITDTAALFRYREALAKNDKIKPHTKNKRLNVAKKFCKFAFRNGFAPVDLTIDELSGDSVERFKTERLPKPGVSPQDAAKITDALAGCQDNQLRAMVALLLYTGVRRGTLRGLKVENIDLANKVIDVDVAKGNNPYRVPIIPLLEAHLQPLLAEVKSGYLFTSKSYNNAGGQLSNAAIHLRIKEWLAALDLGHYTLHDFRRYFATKLYRNGVDSFSLQILMGHSDIKSTQRYVNAAAFALALPVVVKAMSAV